MGFQSQFHYELRSNQKSPTSRSNQREKDKSTKTPPQLRSNRKSPTLLLVPLLGSEDAALQLNAISAPARRARKRTRWPRCCACLPSGSGEAPRPGSGGPRLAAFSGRGRYSRRMVAVTQKMNLNVDPTVARGCSRTLLFTKSTLHESYRQNHHKFNLPASVILKITTTTMVSSYHHIKRWCNPTTVSS